MTELTRTSYWPVCLPMYSLCQQTDACNIHHALHFIARQKGRGTLLGWHREALELPASVVVCPPVQAVHCWAVSLTLYFPMGHLWYLLVENLQYSPALQSETRMHSSRMRTVSCGGVCFGRCLLPRGGVYSRGVSAPGGCLLPEGMSAPRGDVCSQGGACSGGCLLWGVCVCSGGVVSQHALRQTPPPPCGQTDACKNITFATSLRMESMVTV